MMTKKSPQLRFEGFTDDWEERKLRDLLNKNSEKNKNLSVINVESVSNKTGFTKQTDQFEDYSVASADLSNYYVIREKQFAYNPSRINVGSIAYKDLGDEISVVSPLYVSFSTKKVLNDGFLWNWFKTASFDAQRQRLSEGGVRDTLSFNQLSEMNTMFPTYPEQEKIGSFFKQLDNTIALHQRKLDLLKEQKKGYLQKMFPKNGEKVPELRFAGFADDWEEHKVGNFLSESKIKGSDGSVSKKLTVKLWRKGIVPKEEIYKGSSATQYYIRLAGQFMYGKLDFLNQAFGILPNELDGYESTLDSPAFDFKDGINPNFFLEYVCRENFYKYQGNIANGSRKAKRIHADTFFDMPITIPNFEEQQKIGSFFKQLDDTIALHQRKLDLLKEQKKGFLQKMFV